jgi:hypothetical protein
MGGLIASGAPSAETAEILSRLWIAGVIPLFVGLALIANGVVVSKKLVEAARRDAPVGQAGLEGFANPPSLRAADTNGIIQPFSVTEQTTKHLGRSGEKY